MGNDLRTKDLEQGLENVFVARVVQHVATRGDGTRNGCVKIVIEIQNNTIRFHRYLKHALEMVFRTPAFHPCFESNYNVFVLFVNKWVSA